MLFLFNFGIESFLTIAVLAILSALALPAPKGWRACLKSAVTVPVIAIFLGIGLYVSIHLVAVSIQLSAAQTVPTAQKTVPDTEA